MPSQKPILGKKQRYVIAGIVAVIGITIAFYNSETSHPYKNSKTWNFDSNQNGTVPQGFSYSATDNVTSWIVRSESDAPSGPNILEKIPLNDTSETHLQILPDSPTVDNANITMKFKIVSGEKAKSAGMILRFIDLKHYFVLMADSTANRISLCKQTPEFLLICNYEKQVTITTGDWHSINAIVSSAGVSVSLDDQVVIRANDHNYITGQMGLWTKKDTKAFFDDIKIEY